MSEPTIQCQPDTPDCLVNSAWVKWASTTVNELEAQVTLLSERFNGANGRLEDMTNKRNALDIVIAGLKAQVAELEQAAKDDYNRYVAAINKCRYEEVDDE